MGSLKRLLRHKIFYLVIGIFISIIFVVNLSFFVYTNAQYNREISRQKDSLESMVAHLASQEEPSVLLNYLEHYTHINNVQVAVKGSDDTLLFCSCNTEKMSPFEPIYYNDKAVGSISVNFEYSLLGQEMALGFIILNMSSIVLFLMIGSLLRKYLFKQNRMLVSDIQNVSETHYNFQFQEFEYLNKVIKDASHQEHKLRKVYESHIQSLAHDIKTPLTASMIYLEAMDQGRLSYTKSILEEIQNELKLIESYIPKFIETNVNKLSYRHDISESIFQYLKKYEEVFNTKNIVIKSNLEMLKVDISEVDLKRLIENLVYNAFYYSENHSTITVSTNKEKRTLIIEDTGIGMTKKTVDKILKGRYRDQRAIKYNTKGSGLGYQIISEIIKNLNGTITISSKINVGTKVTIYFS